MNFFLSWFSWNCKSIFNSPTQIYLCCRALFETINCSEKALYLFITTFFLHGVQLINLFISCNRWSKITRQFYINQNDRWSKRHLNEMISKYTLEFWIDGTRRLLIIPFFATLPNLIQHSPFINFGEFCQPPLLFQTPRLLIHVHSRQR